MSASREKKDRKAPVSASSEQAKSTSKSKIAAILTAVVVVLLIAVIVLFKGPFLRQWTTAVTVGDHKLSPVMVRYYYSEVFNNFLTNYESLASYIFESSEDIDQQIFDEETGETWGDYFMDSALDQIKVVYAVYDEAMANGYTLSEEGQEDIDSTLSYISMYASYYSVTENTYVESLYGPGSTMDSLEEYLRINAIASDYQAYVEESFEYSAEDIAAQQAASPETYNCYAYHSYYISGVAGEDEDAEAAMAEAKETADTIYDAATVAENTAEENLDNYLIQISNITGSDSYLDGSLTLNDNVFASSLDETVKDWILDEKRNFGDAEIIESENGYYVLYFVSVDANDYNTVNARVIPIDAVATDEDDGWANALEQKTAMEEDLADAEEFNDDFFYNLALAYSDDDDTMYTGGKYENISKSNSFSDAVTAWLFNENRAEGDWEILLTNDGYCFAYYESAGNVYRDYLAESDLRNTDYTVWYEATTGIDDPVCNDLGMKYFVTELSYSAS